MGCIYRKSQHVICLVLFLCCLLGACDQKYRVTIIGPDGTLKILGPLSGFDVSLSDGTWLVVGDLRAGQLGIVTSAGVRALLVRGTHAEFALVRPLNASLLATPFLEWSWQVAEHSGEVHQTHILVGFRAPPDAIVYTHSDFSNQLPDTLATDRMIAIKWGDSALGRGHFRSGDTDGKVPVYVARGGKENTGRWWREGLDLSQLYADAWPDDNMSRVQVNFVAIVASVEETRTHMHLSDIDLFR